MTSEAYVELAFDILVEAAPTRYRSTQRGDVREGLFFLVGAICAASRAIDAFASAHPVSSGRRRVGGKVRLDDEYLDRIGNLNVREVGSTPRPPRRATSGLFRSVAVHSLNVELAALFAATPGFAVQMHRALVDHGRDQVWLRDQLAEAALKKSSRAHTLPHDVRKLMGVISHRTRRNTKTSASRAAASLHATLRSIRLTDGLGTATTFSNALRAWRRNAATPGAAMWVI